MTNLTLNLLTTTIVAPPSNASKWQMGFNSAFKGLIVAFRNFASARKEDQVKRTFHSQQSSWLLHVDRGSNPA